MKTTTIQLFSRDIEKIKKKENKNTKILLK